MEAAAYFESIPFDETRDYVKHVAANLYYYRMRLAGVPANLRQLLGNVPASTALAVAAPTPKPAPKKVAAARARER